MAGLSLPARALLDTWSAGRRLHPLDRALLLLSLTAPERPTHAWAALPLGERNAALLRLRLDLAGDALELNDRCAACGEALEFTAHATDLLAAHEPPREAYLLEIEAFRLTYRLPNSLDLAATLRHPAAEAWRVLTRRILLAPRHDGEFQTATDLPQPHIAALADGVRAADPLAEIHFPLRCTRPGCGHRWQGVFDVAAYLWIELEDQAKRLMADIHELAQAFGWTEDTVLALDPARRYYYLEAIGR